jgi:hypothetical protein
VFLSCLTLGAGCSGAEETSSSSYGGAGGATPSPPDAAVSGTGGSGTGRTGGASGAAGAGAGTTDAGRPYDPDAGFDWPEALDGGKCRAGTYSGTYECQVNAAGFMFPVTGQVSFKLEPSASGEFLEIKDGKLNANVVEFGVTMTGDLAGKLTCLTNQFTATIQNGNYTIAIFPIPTPFLGDLSGTLDRLTSTMAGQWNLMTPPAPGAMSIGCTGPWRVTLQP